MNIRISIIGSLSAREIIEEQTIRRLLKLQPESLSHQAAFTGKVDTRIYCDGIQVLKMNKNRRYPSFAVARQWCQLQMKKEIDYDVYHPDRTWLALELDGSYLAANLTPKLTPLHCIDFKQIDRAERVRLLVSLAELYLSFAGRYQLRLDEGLSNFALLDDGICYLDDDLYPWDGFVSFTAMLANWLRKSSLMAMDLQAWKSFAAQLVLLLRHFSSDAADMVCEALVDQVVGRDDAMKQCVLRTLRPDQADYTLASEAAVWPKPLQPIALIADVHANLPAFKAVLAAMDQIGVTQYLMLGDVVGYGPNPSACIDLVRERQMYCLRGNHDHYVAHKGDVRVAMGMMARHTGDWTVDQLCDADLQWLGALPVRFRNQTWMAVHGAPVDKSFFNAYVYEMTSDRNLNHLDDIGMKLCIHGHSHIQGVYARSNGINQPFHNQPRMDIGAMDVALLCPGSVGQNRSGTPVAQAAIFYPDKMAIEMLELPYDTAPLIADMHQADFPQTFIDRIQQGR